MMRATSRRLSAQRHATCRMRSVPIARRRGRARRFCLPTAPPCGRTEREHKLLLSEMPRDEASVRKHLPESDQGRGTRRANDFGQTNPSGFWPSTFSALDQSLAFRLKNPLYFSCCLQGGLFCYSRELHEAAPSESGRFRRDEACLAPLSHVPRSRRATHASPLRISSAGHVRY
jgi:hypothetical protein